MTRVRLIKQEETGGAYFASPNSNVQFIPTGCKVLDLALGGGWAEGRIANIVGDKSTGKTLLCIEAAANFAQKHKKGRILYREAEAAFDEAYAEALGMPVERIEFCDDKPMETVEDFFEDLGAVISKAEQTGDPALYMLDSLDSLSDRDELKRKMDEGSYGVAKPKLLGQLFRRLVRRAQVAGVTIIIVSQIRDKIGVTFGRKYSRSGGRALDFYASQVVYLAHIQTLSRQVNKISRPTGIAIKAQITKNKVGLPFREAEFEISFGYGIEDEIACEDYLIKAGLPDRKSEKMSKDQLTKFLKAASDDDLRELTERRWWEIEKSFLPKKRKYE